MLLSVFTPTHRVEHLPAVWSCLLHQTHKDWEWVVVPNGANYPVIADALIRLVKGDKRAKIVVYSGILPITRTEPGLAAVMGHEIAHATLRHGSQRLLKTQLAQTILQGASVSVSLADMSVEQQRAVLGAIGMGTQVGVLLPFSREHESEADERGLLYTARAGYDPREAIAFWQRMNEAGAGQPPEFLSTHPAHGTRIQRLQEFMPKAVAEYEGASGLTR